MSATERHARETRASLERTLRLQRKLRRLANELRRLMTKTDDALRHVARVIIERDDATIDRIVSGRDESNPMQVAAAADRED